MELAEDNHLECEVNEHQNYPASPTDRKGTESWNKTKLHWCKT